MKKLNALMVISFVLLANMILKAQLSGTVGYSYFFDDNPLRTKIGESEFVNSVKSEINYRLLDRELYAGYSGNFNAFKTIGDRTFQLHQFGLNYSFNTSDFEEENVYSGLVYSLKKGRGDFAAYDYSQIAGFINGRFPLDEAMFIKGGFNTSYKSFPSLNSLVHFENFAFSQFSTFFSTGTGVFLEAGVGYMSYNYDYIMTSSTMTNGNGRMQGRMSGSSKTKSYGVAQLRSMIKVSQSVFENTGINFYYLNRSNLKTNKGMFVSASYIYSGDDELWDDPYGFSSNDIGSEFTQKLPYEMTLKLSAEYSTRHYINNLADTLNSTQRVDNRFGFWGGISKSFSELPFVSSIDISIDYMLINNKSNAGLFDYKNNMLQFGLQFNF